MIIYTVEENTEAGHDIWFFKTKKLAKIFFNSLDKKEDFLEGTVFVNTKIGESLRSYDK